MKSQQLPENLIEKILDTEDYVNLEQRRQIPHARQYDTINLDGKIILGIFGSGLESTGKRMSEEQRKVGEKASIELGNVLADFADQIVLETGACPRDAFPTIAAYTAKKKNPKLQHIGIAPDGTEEEFINEGKSTIYDDVLLYNGIIYTRLTFEDRDNVLARAINAAVVVGGQSGTLHECSATFDIGLKKPKALGFMQGSGGMADILHGIFSKIWEIKQPPYISFIEDTNPKNLLEKIIAEYKVKELQYQSPIQARKIVKMNLYKKWSHGKEYLFLELRYVGVPATELLPQMKPLQQNIIFGMDEHELYADLHDSRIAGKEQKLRKKWREKGVMQRKHMSEQDIMLKWLNHIRTFDPDRVTTLYHCDYTIKKNAPLGTLNAKH